MGMAVTNEKHDKFLDEEARRMLREKALDELSKPLSVTFGAFGPASLHAGFTALRAGKPKRIPVSTMGEAETVVVRNRTTLGQEPVHQVSFRYQRQALLEDIH